jgi:MYXO-CTERM domain-containing protein
VQLDDGTATSTVATLSLAVAPAVPLSGVAEGCGCASSGAEGGLWLLSLLALVALIGRRRRTAG